MVNVARSLASFLLVLQGLVIGQDVFNLTDPSICPADRSHHAQVNLTDRYVFFTLDGEDEVASRTCAINVKTSPPHTGLMLFIDRMYLRSGGDGCVDHIQFEIEDKIPFINMRKSKKMCGHVHSYSYDVDNGNMMMLFQISPTRPSGQTDRTHVKITVTPYKKTKDYARRRYEGCYKKSHYIPSAFFCDGAVNCALDADPRDEADSRCNTTPAPPPSPPPTTPSYDNSNTLKEYDNLGFESEDLRLGTIISVSLGVLVGLACCMVCCVKRCSRVSRPSSPVSQDACHEMRLSGLPVHPSQREYQRANNPHAPSAPRVSSGYTEVPATQIPGTPESGRDRGATPPPSYSEIFPDGPQNNKEDDVSSVV